MMMPTPRAMGLPRKFEYWRPTQMDAIRSILLCRKRFLLQSQPTGSGKSLTYVAASRLASRDKPDGTPYRVCILTSTKALQDQLLQDFEEIGMVCVKGMNAYDCKAMPSVTCNAGPCHAGMRCDIKSECHYYAAHAKAKESSLVVTNYAYWMTINAYTDEGLGAFDLLVLDEAHNAPIVLLDFLGLDVNTQELKDMHESIPDYGQDIARWKLWADTLRSMFEIKLARITTNVQQGIHLATNLVKLAKLKSLVSRMHNIGSRLDSSHWYVDRYEDGVRFAISRPWPGMAEQVLFRGIPKILLTSATVNCKTSEMLGIPNDNIQAEDYPSTFPADRCPVYHVPTLRMNKSTSEQSIIRILVPQIDRIVEARLDRKGIIHAHSYDRAKIIAQYTRHKGIVYAHNRFNHREVLEAFRRSDPPAVIVSPILSTGYDFPYEQCEYQIIAKLPFPSLGDAVFRARMEHDEGLLDYIMAQKLVQSCGRGMRSQDDWCETFILDDSWEWWYRDNAALLPVWFAMQIKRTATIPRPIMRRNGSA